MVATEWNDILRMVENFDVSNYGATRNHLGGSVSKLSPYLSRGVLSTKRVFEMLLNRKVDKRTLIPFLKELAWREYFQSVWNTLGDGINNDILHQQNNGTRWEIPKAVVDGQTGIIAIDNGINELYNTGYIHNHMRLYIAGLVCNVGQCHWRYGAQWMYYYLLDADWASNALSWQWVAGCFSSKKYFANQQNINTYSGLHQSGTFLDVPYEVLINCKIPDVLHKTTMFRCHTRLPVCEKIEIEINRPIYIYNFYNMDPLWGRGKHNQHILLLEPDFFKKYPICHRSMQFLLGLSRNIENIRLAVGAFDEVFAPEHYPYIYFKQHPTTIHYIGNMQPREFVFEKVKGFYPSFSKYWKQCEYYLDEIFQSA